MRFERWAPLAAALLTLGVAYYLPAEGAALAPETLTFVMWAAGLTLTLMTLATVSLLTVLLSPRDSVIGRQRHTAAYRTFAGYIVEAALLGLVATALTGVYLASSLLAPLQAALVSAQPLWWAVVAGALASHLRTYAVFLIWIRAPQPAPSQLGFTTEADTATVTTAPAPRVVSPAPLDAWAASASDAAFATPFPTAQAVGESHPWTAG